MSFRSVPEEYPFSTRDFLQRTRRNLTQKIQRPTTTFIGKGNQLGLRSKLQLVAISEGQLLLTSSENENKIFHILGLRQFRNFRALHGLTSYNKKSLSVKSYYSSSNFCVKLACRIDYISRNQLLLCSAGLSISSY